MTAAGTTRPSVRSPSLDASRSWRRRPSRDGGVKLTPKGTAGYVVFAEPIQAVRAARAVVNDRTRVAVDFGDLEMRDDEPVGPPLARAARLVAVAHPGQVLLSSAAHDALTAAAQAGWAAESLGRFDIVGLDPGVLRLPARRATGSAPSSPISASTGSRHRSPAGWSGRCPATSCGR